MSGDTGGDPVYAASAAVPSVCLSPGAGGGHAQGDHEAEDDSC